MPKTKNKKNENEDLFRIATFILFDAAVFHDALAGSRAEIRPLASVGEEEELQRFFLAEWEKILKIDYEPIFLLAKEVLASFPSGVTTEEILHRVKNEAQSIVSSGILLRHDFMGRLYHKLLLRTTGQYYATYYTSIPTAWLLATVAVRSPNPEWKLESLADIEAFRVLDPACGSGTLLSASYMALKDRYVRTRPKTIDLGGLHKRLIQDVIAGWDVLDFAAHLSLTTLALHSSKTSVDSSHVYTMALGVSEDATIHLGSLDHLDPQGRLTGKGFSKASVRHGLGGRLEQQVEAPEADLIIMNPPFSRSANPNIKFGFTNADAKRRMNEELSRVGAAVGMSGIGQAGLGAYFLVLARKLVKNEGRVAYVLPRSMLSGVSWEKVRTLYLKDFEIEYIISNYDPGDALRGIDPWSWSENTDLGEVLAICRRTKKSAAERMTTYVNLWNKPANEVESLLMGTQIVEARNAPKMLKGGEWSNIMLGEKAVGTAFQIAQSNLSYNWLHPCTFARPSLCRFALVDPIKKKGWVKFEEVYKSTGVDIKQVKDNFAEQEAKSTWRMVWGHQQDMNHIKLAAKHVGYGREKRGSKSRELHERGSSTFLLAERPHLGTEALLAMRTTQPVLTTAFWEVRLKDDAWVPFFLLWFNSTYGIVRFLASATSSMADIFKMKKDQMTTMLVPDPTTFEHASFEALAREVEGEEFQPYAAEFTLAAQGEGPRRKIDDALREALGLERIRRDVYDELARDPVLTRVRI